MKLAVCILFLMGAALAARLDNNYLPPTGADVSGGSNGAISAPFGPGGPGGRGPGGNGPGGSGPGGSGPGGRRPGGSSPGGSGLGGGAPAPSGDVVPIISQTFEPNMGDGTYSFSFEAGNGIKAEEKGRQKELPDGAGTVVEGSFSYPGPDGNLISITYTADENGFVPKGDHLPTPPPIPEEIRKALEQSGGAGDTSGGNGITPGGGGAPGGGPSPGAGGPSGYPQSGVPGAGGPGTPGGRGPGGNGYSYPQPGK